jgi:hypothetical protein
MAVIRIELESGTDVLLLETGDALLSEQSDEAPAYTHPTLSAATALEIGATSFKPSVTYTFT